MSSNFEYKASGGQALLVLGFTFFCALLTVMIFGKTEYFSGTIIERANDAIHGFDPLNLLKDCYCYFDNTAKQKQKKKEKTKGTGFFCRMYVTLYMLGNVGFFYEVFPRLYLIGYSEFTRYTILTLVIFNLILLYNASCGNPGYITNENHAQVLDLYDWDGVYYTKRTCTTCNFIKPGKSKHCSICNRCVAMYDHHCIWLNNCIGINNYKYFMSFLITFTIILAWGICILAQLIFIDVSNNKAISSAIKTVFNDVLSGVSTDLHAYKLTMAVAEINYIQSTLFAVFVFLLPSFVFFICYQCNLILHSMSTNEKNTRKRWTKLIKQGRLYKLKTQQSENPGINTEVERPLEYFPGDFIPDMEKYEKASLDDIKIPYPGQTLRNIKLMLSSVK